MKTHILTFLILITLPAYSPAVEWFEDPCNFMVTSKESCIYKVNNFNFSIKSNGTIKYTKDKTEYIIKLTLPTYNQFDAIRHAEIIGNLLFFSFGITDIESGSTIIAAVNLKNGKLLWQKDIPAFNSSPLLITKKALYVGAIGYIAKIHINNGELYWYHNNLYEHDTQAYNSFNKPYIEGGNVIYPEDKVSTARYTGIRKIIVNSKSGKLISK